MRNFLRSHGTSTANEYMKKSSQVPPSEKMQTLNGFGRYSGESALKELFGRPYILDVLYLLYEAHTHTSRFITY